MNHANNDESDKKNHFGDEIDDLLEIGIILDEKPATDASQREKTADDHNDTGSTETPEKEGAVLKNSPENTAQAAINPGDGNKENLAPHPPEPADKALILDEIRGISRRIDQLAVHFEGKIKYDEHKNQIIDDLHRQLQDFRDGIIKKHLLSMITDIIKVIDDTRKFKAHYENTEQPEGASGVLLDFMGQIASDLEDIFTFQGIYPFTGVENTFDSARQRIIKKVETDDPEKNRRIAESLRPGYEWEGKVIRPEMVSIYIYNDPNDKAGES